MKKLNLILTIAISVVAAIGLFFVIYFITSGTKADSEGTVVIELIDIDESIIKTKEIEFYVEDTLSKVISDNFENVVFDKGMLMNIENYVTPTDDWSTFISVYVNGEMSMVGINDIKLEDGLKVSLIITENTYNYE